MKAISREITLGVAAVFSVMVFVPKAGACGAPNLQVPFQFPQQNAAMRPLAPSYEADKASVRGPSAASMVGLWKVQFLSKGNTSHNPSIPDGALVDFGYSQWHSDGTEILNSGGHSPASGNWCLGVWGQTGYLTFELNHFPIAYNAATGMIANYINIREQNTLSPSGDSYSGTFTMDIYDPKGNPVDHLAGTVVATRLTVDSMFPAAAAGN